MATLTGTLIAYQFIKRLVKPFDEWEAYKLGIIDADGKTLKEPETIQEKKAFDKVDVLIRNIKVLIEKIPFGKSKLGSLAAALWLLKEHHGVESDTDFDAEIAKNINILSNINIDESIIDDVVVKGYYLGNENKLLYIKDDSFPLGYVCEIPVYEAIDVLTKEREIITKYNIRRLN